MSTLLAPVRPTFRALAEAMVPATQHYGAAEWAEMEAMVETALGARPRALQQQLLTFVRVVNLLAVPLSGRTLVALRAAARERVLHRLERAPVALLRRGVWGVRTLIFMGHYARVRDGGRGRGGGEGGGGLPPEKTEAGPSLRSGRRA